MIRSRYNTKVIMLSEVKIIIKIKEGAKVVRQNMKMTIKVERKRGEERRALKIYLREGMARKTLNVRK